MTVMRKLFVACALAFSLPGSPAAQQAAGGVQAAGEIAVYRITSCGCCTKWMDHLKGQGFAVAEHVVATRDAAPARARVPEALRSCHTAEVGGYIVEGHVPASVVKDLLRQRPPVAGIAVPGMPAGSPGMESPEPVAYNVMAFDASGNTYVFATIDPAKTKR